MTDTELKALGVVRNADLKPLTTFAVPAKAKFYVEVKSLDALRRVLSHPELSREPRLVLGGGSNILFTKDRSMSALQALTKKFIREPLPSADWLKVMP